ncbi:MAG: S9 family peptidase, partial [Pseudomonadota bacterium]
MLNGNVEAEGKSYWKLTGFGHSRDHSLAFYDVDENGSEFCRLRIRDLESGRDLADVIEDVGSVAWSADSKSLIYVKVDENHRPKWVYRHRVGTDVSEDVLIYEEADPGFFVGVGATQSGDFLEINVHRHECSEIRLLDAHNLDEPPRLIAERREGHEYEIEHQGDDLIILTNSNGAVDFRLCHAPVSDPGEANWTELVPHRPGCLILSVGALKGHLVRLERETGLPRIVVRDISNGEEHEIAFDEEAYSLGM